MWVGLAAAVVSPAPLVLSICARPRLPGVSFAAQASPANEEISGSDVLWALQKAAAAAKKRKQAKAKKHKRDTKRDAETTDDETDADAAIPDATPIRIDPSWGPRLVDLENRLQGLSRLI